MRCHATTTAATVALSLGFAAAASAADLAPAPVAGPVYAKAPPPAWSWTGFYIGANAGYGWGTSTAASFSSDAPLAKFFAANEFPTSVPYNTSGWLAGGQLGYNWQMGPAFVWGLETDLQWADIKGSNTVAPVPTVGFIPFDTTVSQKLDWFGTARARAGYLVAPNVLIYGTGGLAYGETELSFSTVTAPPPCGIATCGSGSVSSTKIGWTAGGGIEAALGRNWSVKAEYLYIDLGSQSVTALNTSPVLTVGSFTASNDFRDNMVRLGVNYKFW